MYNWGDGRNKDTILLYLGLFSEISFFYIVLIVTEK